MTVALREDQVEAVIEESLARQFFERGPDGALPADEAREKAAAELVRQATLAYRAGNHSPGVLALIQIAEIDTSASTPSPEGDPMAASDAETLKQQPDQMLPKLLETLSNFPDQNDEVRENIDLIKQEMVTRGLEIPAQFQNGHAPAAEAPQPTPAQEAPAPAQTGPTRQELEDRLSFKHLRAHGLDPSEISGLSDEQIQWIIDHPDPNGAAPQPTQPAAAPASTQQEEAVQQDPGDVIQTTRMVTERAPDPEPPAPAPEPAAAPQSTVESARDDLEGQITGPILKVYGRGRKDVPNIGDNELRFMIEHPDGQVTMEALEAARALDQGASAPAPAADSEQAESPTIAQQLRAQRETEKTAEPATPEPEPAPAADSAFAPQVPSTAGTTAQVTVTPESAPVVSAPAAAPRDPRELPTNPAQEHIDREKLPVPPEIEGQPPRLPFDLSKCSDDELRSYHAQFHACQSRANYIVGIWEGELRDLVKLRKGQEVAVANNLPQKDGRTKITDAQREAMVQADPEVVRLRNEEHEVERVLRQLRALAEGYGRDVSVCSRQWSMRHKESEAAGGLRA